MSEPESHAPAQGGTWALRLTALLLAALGVFPLADHLGVADPQAWWTRAWHSWLLWALLLLPLAWLLARGHAERWESRLQAWRRLLLAPTRRQFALATGAVVAVFALGVGWMMFGWQGSTIDELTQLWQAHLLASGRLYALAEPHPEFFSTMQTVSWQGRWFAHFPIGGPALQAIGEVLHASWLVNPLLAGVGAAAVYLFVARTADELSARMTALLFALSPFILIIAGSRLDHAGTLAATWIALATLPVWLRAATDASARRSAAVIGLALGCAIIIRPYDGAIVTLVVGAFQAASAGRRGRLWRSLVVQALAGAVPVLMLLAVNRTLTGHPLTFAYDVLNGPEHRPGFHQSPLGFNHTPLVGVFRISTYLMRLNAALLGWPVPVVALAVIGMFAWKRPTRWDLVLIALLVATLGAYALYWGDGSFHGPRFLYQVAPVFLLFIARFPAAIRTHVRAPTLRVAALLLIPLWLATAWLLPASRYLPFGAWGLTAGTGERDVLADQLLREVRRQHLSHALVFVTDGWNARLAARLRAIGVSPFQAQRLATGFDACTLQQHLDEAERRGASPLEMARGIAALASQPTDARLVPGLTVQDQISLPRSATVAPACRWDFDHALGHGLDYARLLPHITLDSLGRPGGEVVYARDFGARNALLRERFGDRTWYVASVVPQGDSLAVSIQPHAPSH